MSAYYRLFSRQWRRGRATEDDMNKAVDRGYITKEEADDIMTQEQESV